MTKKALGSMAQEEGALSLQGQFSSLKDSKRPKDISALRSFRGAYRIRTDDLLHAMETRSQLR